MANNESIDQDIEDQKAKLKAKLAKRPSRKGLSAQKFQRNNKEARKIPESAPAVDVEDKIDSVNSSSKIDGSTNTPEEKSSGNRSQLDEQSTADQQSKKTTTKSRTTASKTKDKNTNQSNTKKKDKDNSTAKRNQNISTNISFEHMILLADLRLKIRRKYKVKTTYADIIENVIKIISKNPVKYFRDFEKNDEARTEPLKVNVSNEYLVMIDDLIFEIRKDQRLKLGYNDVLETGLNVLKNNY